jgi:small ligand-binding sensory domain FIST
MQQTQTLRFCACISDEENTDAASDRVVAEAKQQLADPDLIFIFFTTHHRDSAERLVDKLWLQLDPQACVGCSAEGVIGAGREIERSPGIAVMSAKLPNVRVHPFHIGSDDWRRLLNSPDDLLERLGHEDSTRALIGFGDSWTTPLTQLMQVLDQHAPASKSPLIGGMASGARAAGENVIVRNDQTFDDGFVGVSLSGPLRVQPVVSQGCRPIGKPMVITKARESIVEQLGGKPALAVLHELVQTLDAHEQSLLENGLFLGRAISEYRDSFGRGDFLVRNITGADQDAGVLNVADSVRVGQTVQFHVRDAETASEDLSTMLDPERIGGIDPPPAGALLFSCNGRGTRLFDEPCHDVTLAERKLNGTPVAGFFAAGEIGPVGGKNFIHGHTASFALIRPE